MSELTPDQIGQLANITSVSDFRTFLSQELTITLLNDVVLATIANEFNLGTLTYNYVDEPPNSEHQFFWSSTIDVPPDEGDSNSNKFVANILIQVEDQSGKQ